jgi:hypothetical protein
MEEKQNINNLEENINIKGYMDNTNIILTSSKLKSFGYNEECEKTLKDLTFKNKCIINFKTFKEALQYLKKFNKYVTITNSEYFLILKSNNDLINVTIKIPIITKSEIKNNVKSNYLIDYLLKWIKEFNFKDCLTNLTLLINDDYPLYLELNKIVGGLEYIVIAPTIFN